MHLSKVKTALALFLSLFTAFRGYSQSPATLTACYALDGNVQELVSGLNGTLAAVTPTANRFNVPGTAYQFNGSAASHIQLPNHPLLKPAVEISFSAWVKPSSLGHMQVLFTKNTFTSFFTAYALNTEFSGTGYKFAVYRQNGSGNNSVFGTTNLVAGTWYHVAFSIDNATMKIYVNGILEGSSVVTMPNFSYDVSRTVVLGGTNELNYNDVFHGAIDNARFYTGILNASEVSQLYTADPVCVAITPPPAAGFIAPDTVCLNQPFTPLNTSTGAISSYYWSACNSTVTAPTQTSSTGFVSALNSPVFFSINQDGPNYYMFVSNHNPGSLTRFSYGNSLNNTPVITNLGNFGNTLPPNAEGIWIEKEGANWYGLIVGGPGGSDRIVRLNFGNSLANTPTATNMGNIGNMSFPHRIQIFRSGGNVYGYAINYLSSTITRLNFGNSIANTPTGINLGNLGNLSMPADFSMISYNGNWYVYVCNDNGTLTRLDFGNSLLSTPTATNIGNAGSLSGPRAISVWVECNEVKGVVHEWSANTELALNFPSGPSGPVTSIPLGNTAGFNFPHSMQRFRIGDSRSHFIANVNTNSISRIDYPSCHVIPSSTLQAPAPMTFTSSGSYTLSLICNEGLYDESVYCREIYVRPAITVSVSPTIICAGGTATLSASSAASYTWQPLSNNGNPVTVSPSVTTIYSVSGTYGSGCVSTATAEVQVTPALTLNISPPSATLCAGSAVNLSVTGAANYTWQPGNATGPGISVSPTINTNYTVTGSSPGCPGNTASVSVIVNPKPLVSLAPMVSCAGDPFVLTATAPSSGISWQPGPIPAGPVATVYPVSNTVYTASAVYASGSGTCATTETLAVTVYPLPTITINSSTLFVCEGSSAILTVNGASNYTWSPGSITNTIMIVTPLVTTAYSVTGTNSSGCYSSATFTLAVHQTPTVSASPVGITGSWSVCEGDGLLFTTSGAATYFTIPPSAIAPGTVFPGAYIANPIATTVYTLIGHTSGCYASSLFTVYVNPKPPVAVNKNMVSICPGQTASLSAAGAAYYTWEPGTYTGSVLSASPLSTAAYTVTGTDALGCTNTAVASIVVVASPSLNFGTTPSSVCAGTELVLNVAGALQYTWMPGGYTGNGIATIPMSDVSYTVTGSNGVCSGTANIFIPVVECTVPLVFGLANAATVPAPFQANYYRINFTVIAKNSSNTELRNILLNSDLRKTFPFPCTYTVIGAPRISSPTSGLLSNLLFDGDIQLSLTSPEHSKLPANRQDTIRYSVLLDPKGFTGLAANSVVGFASTLNKILLSDSSNNGFSWDPDQDGNPTNNNVVTLIDINPVDLFIPEGFSPDDDGRNDLFRITGLNARSARFTIFNRWGNKVYVKEGTEITWDGRSNVAGFGTGNDKLPPSTYYYVFEFTDGDKRSISGYIVMRY